MKDLWSISTQWSLLALQGEHDAPGERLHQIANGYMGYRGTLDEFGPEESVGITLAGIFDRRRLGVAELVNAPNGGFTRVSLDGVELSALGGQSPAASADAALRQRRVRARETTFASPGEDPHADQNHRASWSADTPELLGVIKFSLRCDQAAIKVTIRTGIDYNIWDLNGPAPSRSFPPRKNGIPVLLVHGRQRTRIRSGSWSPKPSTSGSQARRRMSPGVQSATSA